MGIDTFSPQGCHVMAKPSGSKCNIDCSYCFYLEKEKLYPESASSPTSWKMDDATLERYVIQHIEAQSSNEMTFAWQGGEPTLLGLAFFEKAMALQAKYGLGKTITNTLQTNGLLLDESWCQFFKDHQFLIGISIDGPQHLHDAYRKTRSGKPTHHKVEAAINLLKSFGVEFNTLTVISDVNAKSPLEVYHYLKGIGSAHMQFIPLVEREAQQQTEDGLTLLHPGRSEAVALCDWSVGSEHYGLFMAAIFREWVRQDVGKVWVQLFENTFAMTCGQPAQLCVFSETCGSAFAMENNGDIYACDHYVFPEFKLGNIHTTTIKEINESLANQQFGEKKKHSLSQDCLRCEFRSVCHGGCPKHRFAFSSSGKPDQNYLCHGYKTFFSYSAPYIDLMKKLYQAGHPAAAIMQIIKNKESQ